MKLQSLFLKLRVVSTVARILAVWVSCLALPLSAQPTKTLDAAEIKLALKKLSVLGSVLYVAAHPDDENTALLAYFSKGKSYRTAYLAMTRGDGGQNLIGTEKGPLMGVLRTQELLQARKIDGAEQYFTRAIDFGYSKSPGETLEIWGKEKILSDVVWTIRKFRPDIVITRFPPGGFRTHGHHTASAILAREAFVAASDSTRFPEQLKYVKPYQPRRIFWNTWRPRNSNDQLDVSELIKIDVGAYNPLLGQSYTEISAESRSMHKSQGFGDRGRRGSRLNYLQLLDGEQVANDAFEGIDVSWSRVPGGEKIGRLLQEAYQTFKPETPAASIPELVKAYSELNKLPENTWVEVKRKELLTAIQSCAGLWLEAIAADYAATPGGQVELQLLVVNRSDFPLQLMKISYPFAGSDTSLSVALRANQAVALEKTLTIPATVPYSQPYWLRAEPDRGNYRVADQTLIGRPVNPASSNVTFEVLAGNQRLVFTTPILYRWTDRVQGEQYRSLEIRPDVTMNLDEKVYIFPDAGPRKVKVTLQSARSNLSGQLKLKTPQGWQVTPASVPFQLKNKYDELVVSFTVKPPTNPEVASLKVEAEVDGKKFNHSLVEIHHPHIMRQSLFPEARAKLIRLDLKKSGTDLAYIMGSGDEIPESLEQLGYHVTLLDDASLDDADFSQFDAIITGVRAYNTRTRLKADGKKLLDYVYHGGTLVVQYNVTFGLVTDEIGPYPFTISHDRVTVENAPITYLQKNHPLLNVPNKITEKDFAGWVQERGLYFANSWDGRYQAVLSSHDPDETPKNGGLLYARYGKGVFIYTGFSWFRQLPAGVPGAYRLFVNLISAGSSRGGSN
ncbi:MAG: PIG-L family deacetylase [bacterium]